VSNLISWAMDFHNQWKKDYLDTGVTVHAVEGTFTSVGCTVISPGSFINAQGIRVNTNHFRFLFNKAEVLFTIQRGVRIEYQGATYEVIIDGGSLNTPDDPMDKVITVTAKRI
jgi:hypothetical protein